MNMTDKFEHIGLKTALEIFVPMFIMEHDWSDYDKYDRLLESKKEYVENLLINEKQQGRLEGEIINKTVTDDGIRMTDNNDDPLYELDYVATWFDIKETFRLLLGILNKNGATSTYLNLDITQYNENNGCLDVNDIDAAILKKLETKSLPELKKKVAELTNEKDKWDKSIVAALNIGLQINEKGFSTDMTQEAFAAEFKKELKGLPKKTVMMIQKALPADYRNIGGSPTKALEGIDDATVDIIIDASVFAGYLSHKEDNEVLVELENRLTEDEYEIPTDNYLTAIKKACKKVIRKYA